MRFRALRPFIYVAILAVPVTVLGYGTRVHELLPARALAGRIGPEMLPGLKDADLDAFRAWLWSRSAHLPDSGLRRMFLRRYPDSASFTPVAFRELLMMNGSARVLGIDSFAAVYRAMTPVDRRMDPHDDYVSGTPMQLRVALELGSIYPDLDRRNQSRLLRDAAGRPRLTSTGDTVPFDPMSLNMGKLTGLSSQAHAHYGLNHFPKSSTPATLKTAPWNFAVAIGFPGEVKTFADDNAQLYTDLALLAALDGRPGWRTLSALYAGNAMHYIADVGNAVHDLQVGIYPIFVDATIQSWIRRAISLFGLLRTPPTRNQIGVDIVSNLHTVSERLFEIELTSALRLQAGGRPQDVFPSMRAALLALANGDDSLARVLTRDLTSHGINVAAPDFGRAIADDVVKANMRDGAEVYRITRDIIDTRLRIGRMTVDVDTIPDDEIWRLIRVHRGAVIHTELDDFNAVHARGLARTTTALRAWWDAYLVHARVAPAQRTAVIDEVLTRFLRERLRYLDDADARRYQWAMAHGGKWPL